MKCSGCGTLLPDEAIFCDECGKLVKVENKTANSQQNNNRQNNYQQNNYQQNMQQGQMYYDDQQLKTTKNNPATQSAPLYARDYMAEGGSGYEKSKEPKKKSSTGIIIGIMIGIIVLLIVAIVAILFLNQGEQNGGGSKPMPTATVTPEPKKTSEPVKKISTYDVYKSNKTWTEAKNDAAGSDSHLVYIDDKEEFDKVCKMAEDADINVFWIGARRYKDDSWYDATWLDGSEIEYTKWFSGEPSYVSEDNNDELYLMVFKVDGVWYFNDAENDVERYYKGRMGYIVETEE